jgi:holo-[acyl-carrier protein] synthase
MIIGIGSDIVSHERAEKLKWHEDPRVRSRLFSARELDLSPNNLQQKLAFLSGRFAVKEAVLKCLGTGMIDGISLPEIEVLKDSSHRPIIVLSGEVKNMAFENGINNWHVSISHTNLNTIAFVIAEH